MINYFDLGEYTNTYEALTKMINRPLDDQRANLALIITDGQPSISETDWKKIQLEIGSNNPGWAIFSFGISHASPQEELRRVSNFRFLIGQYISSV